MKNKRVVDDKGRYTGLLDKGHDMRPDAMNYFADQAGLRSKAVKNTSWNVDDLSTAQRELLGEHLCQTNDGAIFLDPVSDARLVNAARALAKVGLVEVDEPQNLPVGFVGEVGISLTEEGQAWLLTLPEGALS